MKKIAILLIVILTAASASSQKRQSGNTSVGAVATVSDSWNLPVEHIGKDDLVGITVYDCPELSRTVRVDGNSDIRLPMLRQAIHAGGLYPLDLEYAITLALVKEKVLVDPVVSVSVLEYRSRPISVIGAVKDTLTFQATGSMTLIEAISHAGGLSENASSELVLTRQHAGTTPPAIRRVSLHDLFTGSDPSLNIVLHGGEIISIPQAARIYVVGNVKRPGTFPLTDGPDSSVMKAVALSGGLEHFSKHTAYIYREVDGQTQRTEIPVSLKKIMNRQAADVPLQANDILYIPDDAGLRASLLVLDRTVMISAGLGATLLYASR